MHVLHKFKLLLMHDVPTVFLIPCFSDFLYFFLRRLCRSSNCIFWLLLMLPIDSSRWDDSNGGHIIKIDENHGLDQILGSMLAIVFGWHNLIFNGDYWQFLVCNIIRKGIWRLILCYSCRGRRGLSIEVEIIKIGGLLNNKTHHLGKVRFE